MVNWGAFFGRQAAKLALRILLDTITCGLAEAVFIPLDIADAVCTAKDIADSLTDVKDALRSSGDTKGLIAAAKAGGVLASGEFDDSDAADPDLASGLVEAAGDLEVEFKKEGGKSLNITSARAVARRVVHCKICGAPGVNRATHKRGHKKAHLHRW